VRILVVTKGQHETKSISILSKRGHRIETAQAVEEALDIIQRDAPEIVILDIERYSLQESRNLLGGVKYLGRPQFLGLMDEGTLAHYDLTLNLDDFIVEPYQPAELIARLEQLNWRRHESDGKSLIKCGDLVINLAKYEVRLAGRSIPFSLKEYELLCFLASHQGRVFSRKALLKAVWGYDYIGGMRTVDVHIRKLRSKIEGSGYSFIKTTRGVGYKFEESVYALSANPVL
jgi:DNA-binding response OmpR family regulator